MPTGKMPTKKTQEKCPQGKMPTGKNGHMGKCPQGKMLTRKNDHREKCPQGKMPTMKNVHMYNSFKIVTGMSAFVKKIAQKRKGILQKLAILIKMCEKRRRTKRITIYAYIYLFNLKWITYIYGLNTSKLKFKIFNSNITVKLR